MARAILDCPHCKRNILNRNEYYTFVLDTPLRVCPFCGGEYLFPYTFEWSIAGLFTRLFYCFFANARCCPAILMVSHLLCHTFNKALIWGIIWVSFCILRLIIFDKGKIRESYKRTHYNSDYIQKLSNMGYMHIARHLDPYYK